MLRRLDPEVTLLSVAHPMKGTQFYDAVADRITGESGGRLTFEMRYSARLYEVAQRLINPHTTSRGVSSNMSRKTRMGGRLYK